LPTGAVRAESASITEKGTIVSNVELPVLRKHTVDGDKRLRRVVPLIRAAVLSAALLVGAASPAGAAVQDHGRTAAISSASSDDALPAMSLAAAAGYVHLSDGRLTFETLEARKAGVSSQALSAESAFVANMNKVLEDRGAAGVDSARDSVTLDVATGAANAQDTTITLLPGITLTISGTGIQLSLTKEAVTEVENVLAIGQAVASLVGAILSVAQVLNAGPIAGIVGAALGLGSDLLKLCTASDGSATFTVLWAGLPSCSGLNLA
jgi:hypothetical protein